MHAKKMGFSMAEMFIAMLAAAILAVTVTVVFIMPIRAMLTNNEYARLRRDMAHAVRIMSTDIRESTITYDDAPAILSGDNTLGLLQNDLRALSITYTQAGANGALSRQVDGQSAEPVILEGLVWFKSSLEPNAEGIVNGVTLLFVMENNNQYITITNKTFVLTRN